MKETFRPNIFADELGNIYSNKTGIMKPLKPQKVNNIRSKKQYWTISNQGLVHRLVASAFIGDVEGKVINHLDGDPSNNQVSNLEIVTQKENHLHAIATGLAPIGENHGRAKYGDDVIADALAKIASGRSTNSVAKELGISQSYLNKVKNKVYRQSS